MQSTAAVRAYAKINLSLEVLGKRGDGYHELVSVMQCLTLHDELSFALADDITLSCGREELAGEANLVLRAARLLREASGTPLGARIELTKGIPVAAGLGGGSSDAAATLEALHRLWRLRFSRRRLLDLAAALGSDVPFFFYGPTALAYGRGERLRPLRPPQPYSVVLAVPHLGIPEKTRRLYSALTPEYYSDGKATAALAALLAAGRQIDPALMVNTFERIVLRDFPLARACRAALLAAGAPWVRLSGSGPASYTFFEDEAVASAVCDRLRKLVARHEATVLVGRTLAGPEP